MAGDPAAAAEHLATGGCAAEARQWIGSGAMARDLRLGLNVGYWAGGPPPGAAEFVREAERLGFESVWTAEAYGSDALIPLAWWGSSTDRIKLGTAIVQISARTPAATAMAAMTLDHLSGGRLILGLGVSGPQVVEGWYGQPFAKPLARMREYIGILRDIWARHGPVTSEGPHYPLPLRAPTDPSWRGPSVGTGLGKSLKSSIHPLREDIPIFLAAEGPKNIALAAELCDGWLALFYSPQHDDLYRGPLDEGFSRDGARRRPEEFEVAATVPLVVTDDIDAATDALRPMYALYFGGMGARSANFHANVPIRMGYEGEVAKIQELYLSGKKQEAAAAVPAKLVEQLTLIGPAEKIRHELEAWRDSSVTTLLIAGDSQTLRTAAELVLG
jgi:F420-dependent oxidoreductase-like protein